MIEEIQSYGLWWLPEQPENKIPGKFSFSPKQGSTLELNETFNCFQNHLPSDDEYLFEKIQLPIILGIFDNGKLTTLYNCYGGPYKIGTGIRLSIFNIEYAFLEVHLETIEELKNFKKLLVRYSYLEEWVNLSGIKIHVPQGEKEEIFIHYQRPQAIKIVTINDSSNLYIEFSPISINPLHRIFSNFYLKANVQQDSFLRIDNIQHESFEKLVDLLFNFRDFVSFAVGQASDIISVQAIADIEDESIVLNQEAQTYSLKKEIKEKRFQILFLVNNFRYKPQQTLKLTNVLFYRNEVEEGLDEIFKKWINLGNEFKYILELLAVNIYSERLYLEYQFVNIVQALESYHAKKYDGKYLPTEKFKNNISCPFKQLIETFPTNHEDPEKGITDDFREALKGKLNFLNSYTLQSRLNELVTIIDVFLPHDFIGNVKDKSTFISRVVKTRNANTHHTEKLHKNAAKGKELYKLTHTLTVIMQIHFLVELGFKENEIKRSFDRTRQIQNEWRASDISN